jgi:hypothetical protein
MDAESDVDSNRKPGPATTIWNGLVIAFVVVGIGFAAVTYGAMTPYGYWVGTPTKASVDHCDRHGDRDNGYDLYCTGTWSVRGQSQTGPIEPPFRGDEQNEIGARKTVLDVHVHDGTAYTAHSVGKEFYLALALGAGLLGWGSFRLRKAWRARNRD